MGRPKKSIRPRRINTTLPEDLMTKVEAYLKEVYGRQVQQGDLQTFLLSRIRAFFLERDYMDLFRGKTHQQKTSEETQTSREG